MWQVAFDRTLPMVLVALAAEVEVVMEKVR